MLKMQQNRLRLNRIGFNSNPLGRLRLLEENCFAAEEPHLPHHCKVLNSLICADVPLRNYSLACSGAEAVANITVQLRVLYKHIC